MEYAVTTTDVDTINYVSVKNGTGAFNEFKYSDAIYTNGTRLIVITAKNNNTNTTVPK